ncbi:MAG: hypothetical protein RL215_3281 [Planctomycetota bacterium]
MMNSGQSDREMARRSFVIMASLGISVAGMAGMAVSAADGIPADAKPVEGWAVDGTEARSQENRLYIRFTKPLDPDSKLVLPRLVGVVQSVRWLEGKADGMSLQPEPQEWVIRLAEAPAGVEPILLLTLDGPVRLFRPGAVVAAADGQVFLRACEAAVYGRNLRYEPQPHKNTVGYWSVAEDYADWHCEVPADGMYEVDILQGCGAGHGGSAVEVRVQDQPLSLKVVETGHFQNFIWKSLGVVTLKKSGDSLVSVRCLKKQGGAVMDVRAIRLVPAGRTRSQEPQLAAPEQLPEALRGR